MSLVIIRLGFDYVEVLLQDFCMFSLLTFVDNFLVC